MDKTKSPPQRDRSYHSPKLVVVSWSLDVSKSTGTSFHSLYLFGCRYTDNRKEIGRLVFNHWEASCSWSNPHWSEWAGQSRQREWWSLNICKLDVILYWLWNHTHYKIISPRVQSLFNLVVFLHANASGGGVKRRVPFVWQISFHNLRMENEDGSIYHCTPDGNCLGKSIRDSFTWPGRVDENDPAIECMYKSRIQLLAWVVRPMFFDYKWEQMKVSATKVETPIWEMTVGRFKVRWNIGCL